MKKTGKINITVFNNIEYVSINTIDMALLWFNKIGIETLKAKDWFYLFQKVNYREFIKGLMRFELRPKSTKHYDYAYDKYVNNDHIYLISDEIRELFEEKE